MEVIYDNRELSWLKFNERVLEEACDESTPAFERLKFLSITTSNLDEFYMVRVGGLYDSIISNSELPDTKTNFKAKDLLELIYLKTTAFYEKRQFIYDNVIDKLHADGVSICNVDSLSGGRLAVMKKKFERFVLPLLSVQVIDRKNPFPHLENKEVYCALMLEKKGKKYLGLVLKSSSLENVLSLDQKDKSEFVLTDDVIYKYCDTLFSGYKVFDKCNIKFTRNADTDSFDIFNDDYRDSMKKLIKKRKRLAPVKIEVSKHISKEFKKLILNKESSKMILVNRIPLSFNFVNEIEKNIPKELLNNISFGREVPCVPDNFSNETNMMKILRSKDIFLNYPYDSMRIFQKLLDEAAVEKNVTSIKITLYRLNINSNVVSSLIKACENGKDVLVFMELRARFDEENNINYSEILEEAGVRVLYGPNNFKVHSKVCLITARKRDSIEYFTHIGTGNYNEKTSALYTDMNLLTSDFETGNDVKNFFDNISSGKLKEKYNKIITSPMGIEEKLCELIDEEIMFHKTYQNGKIIIKINSLSNKTMIDKLYEAAKFGVKIDLIVRGICCLIPKDIKNIRIISIVGRYLEHSRVYYFHCNGAEKIYISSADLMTRNLEKRVELACIIENRHIKERIKEVLRLEINDHEKGRVMRSDGVYERLERYEDTDSQKILYEIAQKNINNEFLSDKSNKVIKKAKNNKKPNYFKWLWGAR